jgi:hypothetical protein
MTDKPVPTQPADSIIKLDSERKFTTNFFWRKTIGDQIFDLQTTIRDDSEQVEIMGHLDTVILALDEVIGKGGTAKSIGTPPAAVTTVTTTSLPAPARTEEPASSLKLPPPATSPTLQVTTSVDGLKVLETSHLFVTESNGKKYFKIAGGKFSKFGVTVYPEVLTPFFDLTKIESIQYDLPGYIAHFTFEGEGERIKPIKVVKLEKAG